MYKLYYSPGACSLAIHAVLYALHVPFEAARVDIRKGENRQPEFLAINPRGQVPVLQTEDGILRESAVIALYLLEKHPHKLLPEKQRLRVQEWLGFYNSSLHQAYSTYFLMSKNLKDDAAREAALELAARRIGFLWREVEAHLAENTYICGDEPTVVDLFHAVIANWTTILKHPVDLGPNILRLCKDVAALPYFQQALAAEGMSYRLAS